MKLELTVSESDNGRSLKALIKDKLGISERLLKKLKYAQKITVDNKPRRVNMAVFTGENILLDLDFDEDTSDIIPQNLPLDIVYEDDAVIILNKPPNTVVHPTSLHTDGTLANALAYYFKQKGIMRKIRPVVRIDRDTTGLVVFAMNEYIQENLIRQMSTKVFKKEYLGIITGVIESDQGTIELPIARKPDSIMLRQISENGQKSITHYKVIEKFENAALLSFILETGRTHQIRVHCSAIGHPLLGDTLYSDFFTDIINRQALHAKKISFLHPLSKMLLEFDTNIPDDMVKALEILRK